MPSPLNMSGFLPGTEPYETPWHTMNNYMVETSPFDYTYAFGKNENDTTQFGFEMPEMPKLEYPSQTEDRSPDSVCSSTYDESSATRSHVPERCSNMSNKKRPSRDSPGEDSDYSDNESRQSYTKKQKNSSNDGELDSTSFVFACPFFIRYPHKHRTCAKYMLRRVRDVKQHLNRKHRTPDFYCARCYNTFNSAKERDDHTRDSNCDYRENSHFEGITEAQKEQLNNAKERNKISPEDQWFMIWDILFPTIERPKRVSRYSPQEEAVALLRDVWLTKHPELLDELSQVDSKSAVAANSSTIHWLMKKIFDLLEPESSIPTQPTRKPSKTLGHGAAALAIRYMSPGGTLPRSEYIDEPSLKLASSTSDEVSIPSS
ncbi:hypothetical protein PG989_016380 [Apiospora arundinis]